MASVGQKDGIYHIRFCFRDKDYQKSLKTCDQRCAEAAKHSIELAN